MKKVSLIIKGKYVLPMDDKNNILDNSAVIVDGQDIVKIISSESIEGKYEADEIVDIGSGMIMPGLVNTHTHAAMTMFRGLADDLPLDKWLNDNIWPAEKKFLDPDFIELASKLASLEMIKAGITCFNNMYFFEQVTGRVASGAGIRATIGEVLLSFPTASYNSFEEAIELVLKQIDEFKDNELIDVALAPHSIYASDDKMLRRSMELAKDHDLQMHIHLSETKKEFDDSIKKNGKTPLRYLERLGALSERVLAAHGVWLDKDDIGILKEKKVSISYNPSSNMKLASGIAPIDKLIKAGVNVSIGTDGAASNNTLDILSEIKIASLLQKVKNSDPESINAKEAVKMATVNGAKALGKLGQIGSLESGKKADIITIKTDRPHMTPMYDPFSHIVYSANNNDINDVVVNGRLIMKNRKVLTLNEQDILAEARILSKKIYESK